jgi:hypothetical protein
VREGDPEPTVEYEINYVPRQITLSRPCRLLWHCIDIVPGDLFSLVKDDLDVRHQTYAAVAHKGVTLPSRLW